MTEPVVTELDERPRRRWLVVLGYVVAIAVFVLGTSFEWATGVAGLFWASILRGIYIWIRGRRGTELTGAARWEAQRSRVEWKPDVLA